MNDHSIPADESASRGLVETRLEHLSEVIEVQGRAIAGLSHEVESLREQVLHKSSVQQAVDAINAVKPWSRSTFFPPIGGIASGSGCYMQHATCSAIDFQCHEFVEACAEINKAPAYHRKLWEWVFIVHHLRERGMLEPGRRGLVFGVGTEPLPSLFAKLGVQVHATDAPLEIGIEKGWRSSNQHVETLAEIRDPAIVSEQGFAERVTYSRCDMTDIDEDLADFDFCWSSCCFEHLGDIRAGIDFVVNSVEKTLKVGGIACHTTEYNLSSNQHTIESGQTVIYRQQDIDRLSQVLRDRGHKVHPIKIAPDRNPVDFYIDVPPFGNGPHVKLALEQYTVTSIGMVIERGR